MQQGAAFKTVSRGGAQALLLAAVALAGISVGRWVLPESSGDARQAAAVIQEAPVARQGPVSALTVDGPATDLAALYGAAAPDRSSLIERKFAQMDAQDEARLTSPAANTAASSEIVVNGAVQAPRPGPADAIERKFAQMDAEDAR